MSITLSITGENAGDVLEDLKALAKTLIGTDCPVMPELKPGKSIGAVSPTVPAVAAQSIETTGDTPTPSVSTVVSPSDVPPPPPPPPAGASTVTTDSAGVAFDPELHTGTLKKDGTWRLKKGAAAAETPPPPPAPVVEEDDEFAAFASQNAAPPAPVVRKWTDADLSKICNQGATKDGSPDRVKAIIAKYVPAGEVQHSRNIPADVREAFAQELEATIGIQYEG